MERSFEVCLPRRGLCAIVSLLGAMMEDLRKAFDDSTRGEGVQV